MATYRNIFTDDKCPRIKVQHVIQKKWCLLQPLFNTDSLFLKHVIVNWKEKLKSQLLEGRRYNISVYLLPLTRNSFNHETKWHIQLLLWLIQNSYNLQIIHHIFIVQTSLVLWDNQQKTSDPNPVDCQFKAVILLYKRINSLCFELWNVLQNIHYSF